ncbi:MAG TPA: HipA family kinase [Microlunatus sp.]
MNPASQLTVQSSLPSIRAITYLTPLREGGSLPAIVEADDLGTYVVKFTGAGQGARALVAEIIVGELARALGIRTPDLALIEVAGELGRSEPDFEVQELVLASAGMNLAVDFLPGSAGFDPSYPVPADEAARIVWMDALVANVDRSARNTNLLIWHRDLWAIDHGACLRFHHAWGDPERFARSAYRYEDHVLSGIGDPRTVHDQLAGLVTDALLDSITALVPDEWLAPDVHRPDPAAPADAAAARIAYREYLLARLQAAAEWLP